MKFFNPLRLLGYWLVSFSAAIVIVAGWPIVNAEAAYRLNKLRGVHFVLQSTASQPHFDDVVREGDIKILTPVDTNFGLVIPAIGLNAKVFPNVDLANEEEYDQVLSLGVAQALGSAVPGQKGTVYLFGHSANLSFNYSEINAVFYLLGKLKAGDEVNVFYNGWRYTYQITEVNTVSPEKTDFFDNTGEERLVLQTCWPPGTQWQRLVIVAKPTYSQT